MRPDSPVRIGTRFRVAAGAVMLRLGARRHEILRLFTRTAAAFGCPEPAPRAHRTKELLAEYAHFTRRHAEAVLDGMTDPRDLENRLFKAAFDLGNGYRRLLDVRTFADAMAAARLIYSGLGIDFRGGANGTVEVRRCAFADVYTARVCTLISALDRGLIAGLTRGGELMFQKRLTEGAPACRACVTGGIA